MIPLKEKQENVQRSLDCMMNLKIYNKEVRRFLSSEYEVPMYYKRFSKDDIMKGKLMIPAAPCSSLIGLEDVVDFDENLIDEEQMNMETLVQRFTTKYDTSCEVDTLEVPIFTKDSLKLSSIAKSLTNDSQVKLDNSFTKQSEIKIDDIKTGLIEALTFTARVKDLKLQNNKFVININYYSTMEL